jgi:carbamoyltransferase
MRTEMDILVMEDCILFKEEQPAWEEEDWRSELELD